MARIDSDDPERAAKLAAIAAANTDRTTVTYDSSGRTVTGPPGEDGWLNVATATTVLAAVASATGNGEFAGAIKSAGGFVGAATAGTPETAAQKAAETANYDHESATEQAVGKAQTLADKASTKAQLVADKLAPDSANTSASNRGSVPAKGPFLTRLDNFLHDLFGGIFA